MEEGNVEAPKPKRKYTPRRICTDPELKYRYKPKPGPRPGVNPRRKTKRKVYKPERTDAEQRRFSRRSAHEKKKAKPEQAAHLRAYAQLQKVNPAKYSRLGVPDGMNREQAEAAWADARTRAEEMFKQMVDKGIVADVSPEDFERVLLKLEDGSEQIVLVPKTDDAKASVALKEAMVMAIGPMCNQQTKLSAINTVLKFTKSPPATKLEVSKSEDLLAAALADIKNENGDQ